MDETVQYQEHASSSIKKKNANTVKAEEEINLGLFTCSTSDTKPLFNVLDSNTNNAVVADVDSTSNEDKKSMQRWCAKNKIQL